MTSPSHRLLKDRQIVRISHERPSDMRRALPLTLTLPTAHSHRAVRHRRRRVRRALSDALGLRTAYSGSAA